jgi:DNA-binding response OmpR family regulator
MRTGMHVDGARLEAPPSVHAFMGVLMWSDGRTVTDETIVSAMGWEKGSITGNVAVVASHARSAFRATGIDPPFERIRTTGMRWTGTGTGVRMTGRSHAICPGCGYNLIPEEIVVSGRFSHDPRTGLASVDDMVLKGSRQLHALMGTFLRSGGEVLPLAVVADRLGSDSEQPERLVQTLVSLLRRSLRHHGVELPVRNVSCTGYLWTGPETSSRSYHGPPIPARIPSRLPGTTGEDLSDRMHAEEDGRHPCGCPLEPPGLVSGAWSWNITDGLTHAECGTIVRGAGAAMFGRIMAASGRFVQTRRDPTHPDGDASRKAGDNVNVAVYNARARTRALGVEIPLIAGRRKGYAWNGDAPRLIAPDAGAACSRCRGRADAAETLTGLKGDPGSHPEGIRGAALILAEVLRSMRGRFLDNDRALELLGSRSDDKVLKVHVSRIRGAYRAAGLPDPILNRQGRGYAWRTDDAPERGSPEDGSSSDLR